MNRFSLFFPFSFWVSPIFTVYFLCNQNITYQKNVLCLKFWFLGQLLENFPIWIVVGIINETFVFNFLNQRQCASNNSTSNHQLTKQSGSAIASDIIRKRNLLVHRIVEDAGEEGNGAMELSGWHEEKLWRVLQNVSNRLQIRRMGFASKIACQRINGRQDDKWRGS